MPYGLERDMIERMHEVFAGHSAVKTVVLYGSRATGNYHSGSDIDLTLFGKELDYDEVRTISIELDELNLPYMIDASLYRMLDNAALKENIQRVGTVLYSLEGHKGDDTNLKQVRLGDVCRVVNGGTPNTKVDEYWGGSHAWVTPAEMGRLDSPFMQKTRRTLTDEGLKKCSASLLPEYSVVLSSRAPIGYLVINEVPMATNQGCRGLIPGEQLYFKFLYYFLAGNTRLLNELGTGTTFKELSATKLKNISLPLPSTPEQKRLVAILDEAFAAIETATANTNKNLANARELFERVLDATIRPDANDWHTQDLQQDIKFIDYRGRTPQKTESGLRLITAKNVRMGIVRNEPRAYVDPESYDDWMTRGIPAKGDVLFTTEAPLGLVAQLDTSEKMVFAQRIITLQPNRQKIDPCFLHYVLRSPRVQRHIHDNATGATAQGIKASLLKKVPVYFPSTLSQQSTLGNHLSSMENSCQLIAVAYQHKLNKLSNLKQSILHQAFTGELTANPKTADRALSEASL